MNKLKWERTAGGFRSVCGRFEIGPAGPRPGGASYLELRDAVSGAAHLARTEGSAKTQAREILKAERR